MQEEPTGNQHKRDDNELGDVGAGKGEPARRRSRCGAVGRDDRR
jgi:hypothetical protein